MAIANALEDSTFSLYKLWDKASGPKATLNGWEAFHELEATLG